MKSKGLPLFSFGITSLVTMYRNTPLIKLKRDWLINGENFMYDANKTPINGDNERIIFADFFSAIE